MLNRYMDPEGWDRLFGPAQPAAAPEAQADPEPEQGSSRSSLQDLLGGRLRDINAETLVLVALIIIFKWETKVNIY